MTEQEKQEFIKEFQTIVLGNMVADSEVATITLRQYIRGQIQAGVDPELIRANLVRDLREGGQIFGGLRKAFRTQVFGGIEKTADKGIALEQEDRGIELYEWLNIADDNTCSDCLERGNMPAQPYAEWEKMGLPGTGSTVCLWNCRCDIVATGVFTKEMKEEASARYYQEKYNAIHDKQITIEDARKKIGVINE